MTSQAFDISPSPTSRRTGCAFIFLALFSGLLGGLLASPFFHTHPSPALRLSHGFLMTFFVVCPAALGGFGQWIFPSILGAKSTAFPAATRSGLAFLIGGVVFLPVIPIYGLFLWAIGMAFVALDVLASFLEMRTLPFRDIQPVAWSFLATACGLIVTTPIVAALITQALYLGTSVQLEERLIPLLRIPETALMLTPALGLVAFVLGRGSAGRGLMHRVAPYVFATIGLAGPLLWADALFGGAGVPALPYISGMTQLLPCAVLLAALLRDSWAQRISFDAAMPWAVAAVIVFAAGWISPAFGHDIAHSGNAYGSVLALCGGFYEWICARIGNQRLSVMSSVHAALTLIGACCSLAPGLALAGNVLMSVSLAVFGLLGLLLLRDAARRGAIA